MQFLASKKEGLFLSESLHTYARIPIDPSYILYHQFLLQLHLPCEKWDYVKSDTANISVQIPEKFEQMDALTLKFMDVKNFVYPARLFTYFLLKNYLGSCNDYGGVGLLHKRKTHFIFLNSVMEFENFGNRKFEIDDMGRFAFKHIKKSDLQTAFESFFVLIDEKFEAKLQFALTQFVSSTGKHIDKAAWLNRAINLDRLAKLQHFIRPYIY